MFGENTMSTLTVRLPDNTAERLESLAARNRFRTLAAQGDVQQTLAMLGRPDAGVKSEAADLPKRKKQSHGFPWLFEFGGSGEIRTRDQRIKS
jgi:hypothetical protein